MRVRTFFNLTATCLAIALSSSSVMAANLAPAPTADDVFASLVAGGPMPNAATQPVTDQLPTLAMRECNASGNCVLAFHAPDPAEQYVLYGSSNAIEAKPLYSVRVVADVTTPNMWMYDKVYIRVFIHMVPQMQRQFYEISLGPSWGAVSELTVTPYGSGQCTWYAQDGATGNARVLIVADHTTCDAPNQPVVVRFATTIHENDQATNAKAPLTVLKTTRKDFQILYDDSILRYYVDLGKSLPQYFSRHKR